MFSSHLCVLLVQVKQKLFYFCYFYVAYFIFITSSSLNKKNECVTFKNKTNGNMKIGKVETCPSLTLELSFDAAFGTLKHCHESSLR